MNKLFEGILSEHDDYEVNQVIKRSMQRKDLGEMPTMPVGDVELPTIRATKMLSDDLDDKDIANFNNSHSISLTKSQAYEHKHNSSRFRIGRDK